MIYIFNHKKSNNQIQIDASSKQEAINIFAKQNPTFPVARYGADKEIHRILDWEIEEKTS